MSSWESNRNNNFNVDASSVKVNNISSSVNDAFSDYKKWIEKIGDKDSWDGKSSEHMKKAAEEISKIENTIKEQLDKFKEALSEFGNYQRLSKELSSLERLYRKAEMSDDSSMYDLDEIDREIRKVTRQLESVKAKIKGYLSGIYGISTTHNFANFYQIDYAGVSYSGSNDIKNWGCGVTSMAMILHYFLGDLYDANGNIIDPVIEMAKWSDSNGFFIPGYGTDGNFFASVSDEYAIKCDSVNVSKDNLIEALKNGQVAVLLMNPGDFTSSAHYIVVEGIDENGNLIIADPYSTQRSSVSWDPDRVISQVKDMWVFDD